MSVPPPTGRCWPLFYSPKRFQLFGKVFQQVLVGRELGFRYCNDIPNPPDNSG